MLGLDACLEQMRNLRMSVRTWGAALLLSSVSVAYATDSGLLTVRNQGIPHDALYDVCFKQDQGTAVGIAGAVLESDDGGLSWAANDIAEPVTLLGLECQGQNPIIVGQGGAILVKQGDAWQRVESGTTERLLSVSANSQGLAVIVGGFGALLKSEDGGQSWAPIVVDWEAVLNDFLEPHLYDVHVSEAGMITIVGEFELIIRSADGGETWETQNKADSSLFSQFWLDDSTGFAAGQNGQVLRTSDGGTTWERLSTGTDQNLLDVWADGDGSVVISGIRTLLKSGDSGSSFVSVEEGDVPVQWYQAVAASADGSERNVVMVGHSGRVVQVH